MENIQQLYDQAFQLFEENNFDKAKEVIDKALELAPTSIPIRALAMQIIRPFQVAYIEHAEYIVDHDIHYNDTLNRHNEPHGFLDLLIMSYHFSFHKSYLKEKDEDEETKKSDHDMAIRACIYTRKILENGYGTEHLYYYLDFLRRAERYDEIIDIGHFIVKNKTAEELGLPGLKNSTIPDVNEEVYHHKIMDAFFYSGRDLEALEWSNKYLEHYPDDWTMYFSRGEVYCRLNQPEETARQWIIGTRMAGFNEWFTDQIDELGYMVADKQCIEKQILRKRLVDIKDQIPGEKKALYDKINVDAFTSIGQTDKRLIDDAYVEGMLQIKLPPITKEHYFINGRLWLPRILGPHPYLPPDPATNSPENNPESGNKVPEIVPKSSSVKPITIERFGVDLTEVVRSNRYPQVVGRDPEINALIRILIRMEKNNPVLLGEAGVGKTAIILGLAQRINAGKVPVFLKDKRIIELSMSALVGGTMWRGDFETRITEIIKELKSNPDIILFVDELHTIMGAGAANRGDLDVANIAKPALAKGEIRLVGATTSHEYSLYIEKDQAMARRFTPVRVAEMDRTATMEVLKHRVEFWREHHKVTVPEKTLIYAVDLSENHIRNRRFPDKVIDLLDESCAFIRTRNKKQDGKLLTLHEDHVNHVFREWTGTMTEHAVENISEKKKNDKKECRAISEALQKLVVAPPDVLNDLTSLVIQVRHSVKDPVIPFVLLFYGSPGNGKTTAAAALEKTLWPNESDRLMVLNLAEYSDPYSYHRLVGGPPGYAGYNEEGILTSRIKRKPFSIIVLKNIREAHPQIIRFFESLLRTGMFTDKKGQSIVAGDTIFILHFDTKPDKSSIGFSQSAPSDANKEKQLLHTLQSNGLPSAWERVYFKAFHFDALTRANITQVLDLHIERFIYQYEQKGIRLTFSKTIKDQLTNTFYETTGEKRNMEVLIDQYIVPKLRDKMLKSKARIIKRITIS